MKNKSISLVITLQLISIIFLNAIPWPIELQSSVHLINKTYGDWNGYDAGEDFGLGFHGAVDIPADSGTPILAVIDGVVAEINIDTIGHNGWINIGTDTSASLAWHYGHVNLNLNLEEGDSVYIGDTLGVIDSFLAFDNDHLHFQRMDNDFVMWDAHCHPLDSLSPTLSQTPGIHTRAAPLTHHPLCIFYVDDESEDTTNAYESSYLRDSVDILVYAYSKYGENYDCGIYAIGYCIDPIYGGSNIPFRKMLEMRDSITIADSTKYYLT